MAVTQQVSEVGATLSIPAMIAILEGVALFVIIVVWLFKQRSKGRGGGNRNNQTGWYR